MTQPDIIDLSDFFQTKAQATDFSTKIATIIQHLYQTNFSLEAELTQQLGLIKKDTFMKLMRNQGIAEDQTAIKKFLTLILETITSIPMLSLTIAFEPKEQTLKELSHWCVMNLHKQFIFEITVKPDIIAGTIINTNGQHKDYSLSKRFSEFIQTVLTPERHTQETQTQMAQTVISNKNDTFIRN